MKAMRVRRLSHRTTAKNFLALLLPMLAFAGTCGATDVLFLNDGNLTAFDGKTSRSIFAGPKDTAARGPYHRLFDWKQTPGVTRFLVSKGRDGHFLSDSDAPSGVDLWLGDGNGGERQIHASVYCARFSPDGQTLAYTTSDCELRIEEPEGRRLHTVRGAYNPNWKSDGRTVLFEKVPAGGNFHLPETLHLAKLDVATGKVNLLTDGRFDDVRPEFHPSGKWVLFVSGGRSGFASFWKISPDGSEPEQVTNLSLKRVDESFVPTPYKKTLWSADGRWFVYDFKSGEVRQVWGLEFDVSGKLLRAMKLADGLAPQWLEEGKTFAYLKSESGSEQPAIGRLP
jgi:WD40 repeat protein